MRMTARKNKTKQNKERKRKDITIELDGGLELAPQDHLTKRRNVESALFWIETVENR